MKHQFKTPFLNLWAQIVRNTTPWHEILKVCDLLSFVWFSRQTNCKTNVHSVTGYCVSCLLINQIEYKTIAWVTQKFQKTSNSMPFHHNRTNIVSRCISQFKYHCIFLSTIHVYNIGNTAVICYIWSGLIREDFHIDFGSWKQPEGLLSYTVSIWSNKALVVHGLYDTFTCGGAAW